MLQVYDSMISLTAEWQAQCELHPHKTFRGMRPTDWIKRETTQALLQKYAQQEGAVVIVDDKNGKIKGIAGILETSKGRLLSRQGTFAIPEIAQFYREAFQLSKSGSQQKAEQVKVEINPENDPFLELTLDVVFGFLESDEPFPVDFDFAWRWAGYSRKDHAKTALISSLLEENIDYIIFAPEYSGAKNAIATNEDNRGGHNKEFIRLNIDALKQFCLSANTAKGKECRNYVIRCEKELRALAKQDIEYFYKQHKAKVVVTFVSDVHSAWRKRFEDEFFAEAYRVTGHKPARAGHPGWMAHFINNYVYGFFPEGVMEKVNQVNPLVDGRRKRRQHQHLKNSGVSHLTRQLESALQVMRLSPDNDEWQFQQNLNKALGKSIEVSLPLTYRR